MKHAFTIDLEDWFCSHNLSNAIEYEIWEKLPSRIEQNTVRILELLRKSDVKATFFVLGWIADRFPELIETISLEGHEIASHGYSHTLLTSMSKEAFGQDLELSKKAIFSACGIDPKGYRAPAFTIVKSTIWALDVLRKQSFVYDSSIYPISSHPDYGIANAPMDIHKTSGIIEVPLSCAQIMGATVPCSGGAYFRFAPFFLYKQLVDNLVRSGRSLIFYIHPWEIDEKMPMVSLPPLNRLRHYTNTSSTMRKLEQLLDRYEFTSIQEVIHEWRTNLCVVEE